MLKLVSYNSDLRELNIVSLKLGFLRILLSLLSANNRRDGYTGFVIPGLAHDLGGSRFKFINIFHATCLFP